MCYASVHISVLLRLLRWLSSPLMKLLKYCWEMVRVQSWEVVIIFLFVSHFADEGTLEILIILLSMNHSAAKVRRLYDIANVLSSMNLIEKVKTYSVRHEIVHRPTFVVLFTKYFLLINPETPMFLWSYADPYYRYQEECFQVDRAQRETGWIRWCCNDRWP